MDSEKPPTNESRRVVGLQGAARTLQILGALLFVYSTLSFGCLRGGPRGETLSAIAFLSGGFVTGLLMLGAGSCSRWATACSRPILAVSLILFGFLGAPTAGCGGVGGYLYERLHEEYRLEWESFRVAGEVGDAAQQYRRANGRWPVTMRELMASPQALPAPPRDPATGHRIDFGEPGPDYVTLVLYDEVGRAVSSSTLWPAPLKEETEKP